MEKKNISKEETETWQCGLLVLLQSGSDCAVNASIYILKKKKKIKKKGKTGSRSKWF